MGTIHIYCHVGENWKINDDDDDDDGDDNDDDDDDDDNDENFRQLNSMIVIAL